MALGLLALGLDPERSVLFRQSDRPEHVELSWLFASVTPVSWVERTPSFKEKKRNQPDDVNHALLTYPILQAADIAIYHARYVPVGRDQAAHLELSREIVRREPSHGAFSSNRRRSSPIARSWARTACRRCRSRWATWSRSSPPEVVRKQVMSMVTDTQRIKRTDGRPEVCNVCQLQRSGDDYEALWEGERTAATGCVDMKRLLADRMLDRFAEACERRSGPRGAPGTSRTSCAPAPSGWPDGARDPREAHDRMGLGPIR
jgi:tryptophanyl-tRNA synthetase